MAHPSRVDAPRYWYTLACSAYSSAYCATGADELGVAADLCDSPIANHDDLVGHPDDAPPLVERLQGVASNGVHRVCFRSIRVASGGRSSTGITSLMLNGWIVGTAINNGITGERYFSIIRWYVTIALVRFCEKSFG